MTWSERHLDRTVRRLDAWRRSPRADSSEYGHYKEWIHFSIRLPGTPPGHLLINLNVTERVLSSGVVRTPRLVVLAQRERWTGKIESFELEQVRGAAGELDVRFGDNAVRWQDGGYRLVLRAGEFTADLTLRPRTLPTAPGNVRLPGGRALHWVAMPLLIATGKVTIGRDHYQLKAAQAYHDHNWGDFRWGADLSWDWGFVHPIDSKCPWHVVFMRVSDSAQHRTLSQVALVWKGSEHVRTFYNHELELQLSGTYVTERPVTLPGVMGLLTPGAASGVPACARLRADGGDDELEIEVATQSHARVALPHDSDDFRSVLLNETSGAARVRGRLLAGSFAFEGTAIVEFVRG